MTETIAILVLWLFVINLGIAFGAGLYETRIEIPRWLTPPSEPGSGFRWNAEVAREANVGRKFWGYVTTIPLTLLTLASLIAVWLTPDQVRGWWLIAIVAVLVDRVLTFTYFIPTMVRLTDNETYQGSAAVAKAEQCESA